jgi:hypothetical protein
MLLLSGRHLEATMVECNLPGILVERTEATAGGKYLFVWLKLGADAKSGTAVCRITTPTGLTSLELPLAARTETIHKFQGLATNDVLYLIMPDRFANGDPTNDEPADAAGWHDRSKPRAYHGGDLRGVREHLSCLKDLGVTTLGLMPILQNGAAEDYHGYGATDLYGVEPHLGTLGGFQELVTAAHRQRMKILFDMVLNHTGPRVARPPLPEWFHGTLEHHTNSSTPRKGSLYGETESQSSGHGLFKIVADPHAPSRWSRNLTEGWFFGTLPELNTENPVVAQYLLQNSIWWAESTGLDGYRIDAFPYVSALSSGRLWHLASEESSYVFAGQSEEETVLVAFNNSDRSHELRVSFHDTPVEGTTGLLPLFGEAQANLSGGELHISAPGQSVSIFLLNGMS